VWKLSTFYANPEYQHNGLGQHLLFHEMQSWFDAGINKVVVTTGIHNRNLIGFLEQVGFIVEGVAPERYPGQTEVVLGRHFIRHTLTPTAFADIAALIAERILVAKIRHTTPTEASCESLLHGLPLYGATPPAEILLRWHSPSVQEFILEAEVDGVIRHRLDAYDLETKFHPLVLTWSGREAFIIPIYEEYANQLFEMHRPQLSLFPEAPTRRLLQMDNVYYCYPRYTDVIVRGSPVLFYVTKGQSRGSGVAGNIVGMAFVLDKQVGSPDMLYLEHGQRGVYNIEAINRHQNAQKKAMAIHFSWLRPFATLVSYDAVKAEVPQWNPQTLQAINHNTFLHLCRAGGLRLGGLAAQ